MKTLIWTCRVFLPIAVVWGVYGFGGPTLVDLCEQRLALSHKIAAVAVSALIAPVALVALLPARRRRRQAVGPERKTDTPEQNKSKSA